MRLPGVLTSRVECWHWVLSIFLALAFALSACSTQSHSRAGASVPPNAQDLEQCSMFGRLACAATSKLSGGAALNRQATCIVSRTSGRAVETCVAVEATPQTAGIEANIGSGDSVQLAWSDNSNNEKNFVIERCDQVSIAVEAQKKIASCTGGWRSIGIVGANITRYVDKTALPNHTYLYRVKATNDFGSSDHTNEASIITRSK